MRLVVDIDDDLYRQILPKAKTIIYSGMRSGKTLLTIMLNAIGNGTPLPKGHGRLKDFDKIEWYGCNFEGKGCIEAKGDCSVCNHANCYAKQVRELPTIIKADKEGAEDGTD